MKNKMCSKCIGTGEIVTRRKVKPCDLCKGYGVTSEELAKDFVNHAAFDAEVTYENF
jgi:DnaJ-class molecular chaperone